MIKLNPNRHPYQEAIVIENTAILPGQTETLKLYVGRMPSDARIHILTHIFRSKEEGPVVLCLGGVHGDEINGIEILNQLIHEQKFTDLLKGTVIAIPLLNVFGFNNFARDLHDGKDVNRSFPGSMSGSLASRMARVLTKQILPFVDVIIDLHTGGADRYNYPQVRYSKTDQAVTEIIKGIEIPFSIMSPLIPKSLRKTAKEMHIPTIVYEGGESGRLDNLSINTGKKGILQILGKLGLLELTTPLQPNLPKDILKTTWIRTSFAGIFIRYINAGVFVNKGDILGVVKDPYGTKINTIVSKNSGYLIGHNNASIVNQGDPLYHIGFQQLNVVLDEEEES